MTVGSTTCNRDDGRLVGCTPGRTSPILGYRSAAASSSRVSNGIKVIARSGRGVSKENEITAPKP